MIKYEFTRYSYILEEHDTQAIINWAKENKIKMLELHKTLGISYTHLSRIIHGRRTASSTIVNKLKRLGVKFKK